VQLGCERDGGGGDRREQLAGGGDVGEANAGLATKKGKGGFSASGSSGRSAGGGDYAATLEGVENSRERGTVSKSGDDVDHGNF
jgi:hypothetical protein